MKFPPRNFRAAPSKPDSSRHSHHPRRFQGYSGLLRFVQGCSTLFRDNNSSPISTELASFTGSSPASGMLAGCASNRAQRPGVRRPSAAFARTAKTQAICGPARRMASCIATFQPAFVPVLEALFRPCQPYAGQSKEAQNQVSAPASSIFKPYQPSKSTNLPLPSRIPHHVSCRRQPIPASLLNCTKPPGM